ncbi:hypothetical protein ANN_23283 [Periplaneta americana]|uniref:Uncharacterized protein n=1 Tax=Periplaneta americana TaxID=6978 RepID=A0ABQ8SMP5_PERAM|nr:hypothetical protein ANN_23283 [Periplaneta americana]
MRWRVAGEIGYLTTLYQLLGYLASMKLVVSNGRLLSCLTSVSNPSELESPSFTTIKNNRQIVRRVFVIGCVRKKKTHLSTSFQTVQIPATTGVTVHIEYADIVYVYGLCDENSLRAVAEYHIHVIRIDKKLMYLTHSTPNPVYYPELS